MKINPIDALCLLVCVALLVWALDVRWGDPHSDGIPGFGPVSERYEIIPEDER
jgi:hypothetical protein